MSRPLAREVAVPSLDRPEGMIEHETRTAIRDLIRMKGFEAAREEVAEILIQESDRSRLQ